MKFNKLAIGVLILLFDIPLVHANGNFLNALEEQVLIKRGDNPAEVITDKLAQLKIPFALRGDLNDYQINRDFLPMLPLRLSLGELFSIAKRNGWLNIAHKKDKEGKTLMIIISKSQ